VGFGLLFHGLEQGDDPFQQQSSSLLESYAQRGIEHIRRGEPVVEPAAVFGHRGGQDVDECGEVVMDLGFPGPPGGEVDGGSRAGRLRSPGWHYALKFPSFQNQRFDLGPGVDLVPFIPQRRHLGERVALDHDGRKVASRSGPTETIDTGTPANSSILSM